MTSPTHSLIGEFAVGFVCGLILSYSLLRSPVFRIGLLLTLGLCALRLLNRGGPPHLLATATSVLDSLTAHPAWFQGLLIGKAMTGLLTVARRHRASARRRRERSERAA